MAYSTLSVAHATTLSSIASSRGFFLLLCTQFTLMHICICSQSETLSVQDASLLLKQQEALAKERTELAMQQIEQERAAIQIQKQELEEQQAQLMMQNDLARQATMLDQEKVTLELERLKIEQEKANLELEKQRAEKEKAAMEMEKQRVQLEQAKAEVEAQKKANLELQGQTQAEFEKARAEKDAQKEISAQMELQRAELERARVEIENQKVMLKSVSALRSTSTAAPEQMDAMVKGLSDWERHTAPDGRSYYYNPVTEESKWTLDASMATKSVASTWISKVRKPVAVAEEAEEAEENVVDANRASPQHSLFSYDSDDDLSDYSETEEIDGEDNERATAASNEEDGVKAAHGSPAQPQVGSMLNVSAGMSFLHEDGSTESGSAPRPPSDSPSASTPDALVLGWQRLFTETGEAYWYNDETQESRWTSPTGYDNEDDESDWDSPVPTNRLLQTPSEGILHDLGGTIEVVSTPRVTPPSEFRKASRPQLKRGNTVSAMMSKLEGR